MKLKKSLFFLSFLLLGMAHAVGAQTKSRTLHIAVETDIIDYISLGGFSIWGSVQKHKNRLSISYVNFPNRYRGIYNNTGIKDDDQFLRLSLWRYWNDKYRSG